jgi:hypothetical protein
MKYAIVALALTFAASTYGQQPDGNVSLIPASRSELALPGIKVSWYSGLDKKMVMMRVENVSGKNINAYNISIGIKYADGSTDYDNGYFPSEHMEMFSVVSVNGIEPKSFAAGRSKPGPTNLSRRQRSC